MMHKYNIQVSILLTLVLFILTYFGLGYYYGWLDDVLQNNYFRGIPLHEPIDHFPTVHIFLSKLYQHLYAALPGFPWYGVAFGIWVFLATVNLFVFVLSQFTVFFHKRKWLILLSLVGIYILVWVENVYLINFSRVALLLMGTSYLNIDRLLKETYPPSYLKLRIIYFSFTFLIGLLTRPELIYIILPFLIIYSFREIPKKWHGLKVIGIIALLLIIFKVADHYERDKNEDSTTKSVSHLLNITDGYNTYKNYNELFNEDLRYRSIFLYYLPDSSLLDKRLLDQWGPSSSFSLLSLTKIRENLYTEYHRARYLFSSQYHQPMNWFWKTILFTILNLTLLTISLFRVKKGQYDKWGVGIQAMFLLSFLSCAFLITILSKMEDRVMTPSYIIFSLAHLALWSEQHKEWILSLRWRRSFLWFLLPVIILLLMRINGYLTISNEKQKELVQKKAIIKEINEDFDDKILFYDLWTMTLLHQSPLENIYLNPNNIHTCYGEYWCNFLPKHLNSLKDMCGKTDFISFYKCLYQKRDEVVFVFSKHTRIDLIEDYAAGIYGEKIFFREIKTDANINKIHHSFLPYYYNYGYYVFDDSFSDAK